MTHEYHTPVLQQEVLSYLRPRRGGVYVDCTIGGGGHAELILEQINGHGTLVGFDRDPDALASAGPRLARFGGAVHLLGVPFDRLRTQLTRLDIPMADGILFDLGLSSRQVDEPKRGFAFSADAAIDMRMDPTTGVSGAEVVNTYPVERLKELFKIYGEERMAGPIARRISFARERSAITTTGELAEIVRRVVGGKFLLKSLARVFQAIRIEVNDELGMLSRALEQVVPALAPGGRVVVISYNSLEDRIVKQWIKARAAAGELIALTKKVVIPGDDEQAVNRRSRSAKLRAAERVGASGEMGEAGKVGS